MTFWLGTRTVGPCNHRHGCVSGHCQAWYCRIESREEDDSTIHFAAGVRETVLVLKEALVDVTLDWEFWGFRSSSPRSRKSSSYSWVSRKVCDASVHLRRHVQPLNREVSPWSPGTRPSSFLFALSSDEMIPAKYETVFAMLEAHLGAASGLVLPSLKTPRQQE
jgi:hypothetical protein